MNKIPSIFISGKDVSGEARMVSGLTYSLKGYSHDKYVGMHPTATRLHFLVLIRKGVHARNNCRSL